MHFFSVSSGVGFGRVINLHFCKIANVAVTFEFYYTFGGYFMVRYTFQSIYMVMRHKNDEKKKLTVSINDAPWLDVAKSA